MRFATVYLAVAFLVSLIVIPGMSRVHADDGPLRFFENRIRPLLVEKCLDCHGPDPGRREGGLDLSSRESLLAGGGRGPAAIPGNSGESLLVRLLDGHGDELGMPPKEPLAEDENQL